MRSITTFQNQDMIWLNAAAGMLSTPVGQKTESIAKRPVSRRDAAESEFFSLVWVRSVLHTDNFQHPGNSTILKKSTATDSSPHSFASV